MWMSTSYSNDSCRSHEKETKGAFDDDDEKEMGIQVVTRTAEDYNNVLQSIHINDNQSLPLSKH